MTEQEELVKLRAMIEQMDKTIASKNELILQQTEKIEKQEARIKRQDIQIETMIQALLHARKKLYGPSSEVTSTVVGQLSLFETSEALAKELAIEQKKITIPSYKRVPRKPGVRQEMLSSLPQEIEEYIISPEETCQVCGSELKVVGKKIIRTEVDFIPAKLKVKQIVQQVAKCTVCGTGKNEHPASHFQKAAVPKPILAHSIATPALVAHIMYKKFGLGIPCARQERDWYRQGLVLPRANMANWIIRLSEEWFVPIYDRIHQHLLTCGVLHMDETRIQCNKEKGKKASSQSFMWVMRSAACEEITAAYFHYSRSRSGDIARNLLDGFRGHLVTDAYAGYEKAVGITRALCWSHCRRYYIDSIPLDGKGKEIDGSKGAKGREYINLLFQVEKKIKDLSYEEKKEKRQEASKPILEAFWSWVDETAALPTTNEKLTQALTYSKNQRNYLETFLTDGRIPLSNNLCEANIKPYATARRAWLFADTPKGARANAILYTLIESAKANGLDSYAYLKYLLNEMPNNNHLEHPEIVERYLPWSSELPEECYLA